MDFPDEIKVPTELYVALLDTASTHTPFHIGVKIFPQAQKVLMEQEVKPQIITEGNN